MNFDSFQSFEEAYSGSSSEQQQDLQQHQNQYGQQSLNQYGQQSLNQYGQQSLNQYGEQQSLNQYGEQQSLNQFGEQSLNQFGGQSLNQLGEQIDFSQPIPSFHEEQNLNHDQQPLLENTLSFPPPSTKRRSNYRFCGNVENPYHECTQYCIARYWPGNRPYCLAFCPATRNDRGHTCNGNCAREHGPKNQTIDSDEFPHVKDKFARYMVFCIMNYGYN